MKTTDEDVLDVVSKIGADDLKHATYQAIAREGGRASGWKLAKDQGKKPEEVDAALQGLRDLGVVAATGTGLDGYYYLTSLGFQLRGRLAKSK